tara:strand:+ start:89 stop:724 length:636 start_codon:yes stop_codon:yes gene_type:complete
MKNLTKIICILILVAFIFSCEKEGQIIRDNGEGITIEFLEGLNDNPTYQLSKDSNGFYNLTLDTIENQTIQRITGRLLRNGYPVEDLGSGVQPKNISWESNLYWWLLDGDIVANITYTYLNLLTGELVYVNLPPLVNWKDVIVPTINENSYSDQETGIVNTVIAPIQEMIGDTMKIKMTYIHSITEKEEGTNSFDIIGERVFKDSTYVILR